MKYRPDIDGLRAIAILLVLIYHGGLSLFPSGFIGVDVFFVISGFLITTIIYGALNHDDFSFIDFYNRRLWRLQPVFVCLLFASTVVALLFYLPDDLVQFTRSARKTSLFMSNIFFNHTSTGYFSPDTKQLPLLHTWSLAVEWQCYLVLPLLMYGLYTMLGKRHISGVVYFLTLLSFLVTLYSSKDTPGQTYYLFSSRIFEFLLGACIALIPSSRFSFNHYVAAILGVASFGSIFYVASLPQILMGYPDAYALWVCMATGLLIAVGKFNPSHFLVKCLSVKPLVFIGVLSYSLYIWHWTLFSLLRYQGINETPQVLLFAYLATGLMGYVSWRYIEKPARYFNHLKFHYTLVILLLLPILFTHLSALIIKSYSGLPQRFNEELVTIYQQLNKYSNPQRPLCISNDKTDRKAICNMGSKLPHSKKGLMIGDSFSNHYWGFMDTLGQQGGVSILAEGTSSCLALPEIALYNWWYFKNRIYQKCVDENKKHFQMIKEGHYDYVILGQIWSNYLADHIINREDDERSELLSQQRFKIALDKALNIITVSGAKPVIIKSTAIMQKNALGCFFKHIKLHQAYQQKQCDFLLQLSDKDEWLNVVFNDMKNKYHELIIIDPKDVQCPNQSCRADLNGIPVYRDEGHITDYASYQLGKLYLEQLGNPIA